jgi:predicted DNA-binding antitoxin AbrB/MazE fold protein
MLELELAHDSPPWRGGSRMSQAFEAVSKKGVLRPEKPVTGLTEGQRVWLTLDEGEHLAAIRAGIDDMQATGRIASLAWFVSSRNPGITAVSSHAEPAP